MTTADQIYASLMEEQDIINMTSRSYSEDSVVELSAKLIGEAETEAFKRFATELAPSILNFCVRQDDHPRLAMAIALYSGLVAGFRYGRNSTLSSDLPLRPE